MSYQEGYTNSGQVRPERNETAPPQVPDSAAEFWPMVIEHHLKRLLIIYHTGNIETFRNHLACTNKVMLDVPGWEQAAAELGKTVELMDEQAKMEEMQAKMEEKQMNKQLMEAITNLMKLAQMPSQVTFNYPQFHAPFNEITGNEKVNLRLPNNG